jgi:2-polyprenyl-3-methyl-5-hydroxy-6-metoxy-1,4-benzoquinol methylase
LSQEYYDSIQGKDENHIREFNENFPPLPYGRGKSVIEIGSGRSQYVPMFLEKKFTYTAVEPSKWACDLMSEKWPEITVHNSTFEEFEPTQEYDVAFLAHSLEHFEDAPSALEKLKTVLKPHGLAFILIPDDSDLYNSDHFWFFNSTSLTTMLIEAKYKVNYIVTKRIVPKENFIYCVAENFR